MNYYEWVVPVVGNELWEIEVNGQRLKIEPSLLSVVCRELNSARIDEGLDAITQDL